MKYVIIMKLTNLSTMSRNHLLLIAINYGINTSWRMPSRYIRHKILKSMAYQDYYECQEASERKTDYIKRRIIHFFKIIFHKK